jgi:hypothetical protein
MIAPRESTSFGPFCIKKIDLADQPYTTRLLGAD